MSDSLGSTEKDLSATVLVDEETDAIEGYIIDASLYPDNASRLKTTPDGKTVLIPQPSNDPNDPLNWSRSKKYWILAVVTYTAFLADYTSGSGIVVVIPQAQ